MARWLQRVPDSPAKKPEEIPPGHCYDSADRCDRVWIGYAALEKHYDRHEASARRNRSRDSRDRR